jgi:hypothetical protein
MRCAADALRRRCRVRGRTMIAAEKPVFHLDRAGSEYSRGVARRPIGIVAALAVLAVLTALPVFADPPSGAGAGPAHGAKVPKAPITLTGTITASTDAKGQTVYTLTSGGTTYTLEAGPRWFFGDAHPLKPYVGKSVTITGQKAEGSTVVDVEGVNGTALRAAGKPPWAGGWKVVGQMHPGWTQAKADRFKAKFGDCFPPGRCKANKADKLVPAAPGGH